MSVINETLDNLKQTKKRASGSFNPSSSVYCEKVLKSEKSTLAKKAYIIPISFAMLVGLLFYISQIFFAYTPHKHEKNTYSRSTTTSWFKANLQKISKPALATAKITRKTEISQNFDAKNMYYNAMALLNEGKDQQALQSLQKIVAQYPDFVPAQKVYATLLSSQ
ncbi:MAG: hypothetical protein EBY22_00945 [Gammaproteobacteria bacterium]|nr:hypothetical protein [Gammaproteobacteria bacterium]